MIATTNPGKMREIRAALAGVGIDIVGLDALPRVQEPEETGSSFAENARLKARYYAARTHLLTVAEDSGLEIDALGGEPGVRSARYLGAEASYEDRFAEIQRRLSTAGHGGRSARFVCALAVAAGEEILFEAEGTLEGVIADAAAGAHGFGYDPIFYYPPYGATLAEVGASDKLRVSHRGAAFRELQRWLLAGITDSLRARRRG